MDELRPEWVTPTTSPKEPGSDHVPGRRFGMLLLAAVALAASRLLVSVEQGMSPGLAQDLAAVVGILAGLFGATAVVVIVAVMVIEDRKKQHSPGTGH